MLTGLLEGFTKFCRFSWDWNRQKCIGRIFHKKGQNVSTTTPHKVRADQKLSENSKLRR